MCILLILIIGTATGYNLKCPARAEWSLKANVSCFPMDKYTCLFNLLEDIYMENCLGLDKSSIGSKLVFQPLFNLAVCDAGRYQPIVFTTHCRCDYTQGYNFVTRPNNRCFCNPSDEDCSCFRSTCTTLSADYQCVTDGKIIANSTCQEILPIM